jgi:AcrR family transcriptional regulator
MSQARPERAPPQRHADKREQILQSAVQVFNRMGVKGATLADVAEGVGLNVTSLRHYFTRKEDLAAEAFLRSIDMLQQLALEAGLATADPRERIGHLTRGFFDLRRRIREDEAPLMMQFGDLRTLTDAYADIVWPRYTELFRVLRSVVATPGELAGDRVRVNARAHMLQSQLVRSVFWLDTVAPEDHARAAERFLDVLFNGLTAPGQTPAPLRLDFTEPEAPSRRSAESFLIAATELINEQGYRGASVDAIAARLQVTKGSFYHHLDGKDDLMAACFERTHTVISGAQRAAVTQETRGLDQAFASVGVLVRGQQTAAGPLLRTSVLSAVEPEKRTQMLRRADGLAQRFADMVTDGMIDGSVRPCDSRIAGQVLLSQVSSAEELARWAPGASAANAVELYVMPLFRGILAPADGKTPHGK